jgi:hypothetical protein
VGFLPFGDAAKGPGQADNIAGAATGGARAVRAGQAGEAAVRGVYDIGPKVKIDVNGRKRIPDGMTDEVLSEVKNVAKLSYTRQVQDYWDHAQATGRRMDLYVRGDTKLSAPLVRAMTESDGMFTPRVIP